MLKRLAILLLILAPTTALAEYAPVPLSWTPPTQYESFAAIPDGNIQYYSFSYSQDGGTTWTEFAGAVPASSTSYLWAMPADLPNIDICFRGRTHAVTLSGTLASSGPSNEVCRTPVEIVIDGSPPGPPQGLTLS